MSLALVAVAYLPITLWQRPKHWPPATVVLSVAALGLVCTALAFVAFFELIKEVAPTRATLITYFNPFVAIMLGVVILGEPLTPAIGIGFALILAGSWLATRPVRTAVRTGSR
jgi:drug/metabolite transporter (DMT)-like permease